MSPFLPDKNFGPALCCAFIGAGAVASSLVVAFREKRIKVAAVFSRRVESAVGLAGPGALGSGMDGLTYLPDAVNCLCICVPDDAIASVSGQLSRAGIRWPGRTVLHTSGVKTSSELVSLASEGASTLSWHPVQTFTRTETATLKGISVGIEGSDSAFEFGGRLATLLEATPVWLSPEDKMKVHLAASIASNFVVSILGVSDDILKSCDLSPSLSLSMLQPLVTTSVRNTFSTSPESALTGPIVRGDLSSIAQHLNILQESAPALLPFYVTLATETIRLAVKSGRLSGLDAEALRHLLAQV